MKEVLALTFIVGTLYFFKMYIYLQAFLLECLHDIGGHISNLLDEILAMYPSAVIYPILAAALPKRSDGCRKSDYRKTVINVSVPTCILNMAYC